ncbi:MAG: type I restriction enzyme HsdR N-terminal domain-containing protein [Bacteroidota bacterium]
MQQLNLPEFTPRVREVEGGIQEIYDPFRKKYVRLTPEEWVRQHFLNFMVAHLDFPASLIVVEASLIFNRMTKRFDILAYDKSGKPRMVVECKAPSVGITQDVFDQVAIYNMTLAVDHLVVTNGISHYACKINHEKRTYIFLKDIPTYEILTK